MTGTFQHRSAAFCMMLGPGCAAGFFVALAGFYIHHFQSPAFFVAILLCLYLPYPVIVLMQERADAFFDKKFSTRATYFFRVVLLQLLLAAAALTWMFVPQSPYFVLGMGLLIGAMFGAIGSSSIQMVSMIDPQLATYHRIGSQIGSVLPVVVLLVLGFQHSGSLLEFRLAVATVPVVCGLAGLYLVYLHLRENIFEKAYQRLTYDLDDVLDDDLNDVMTGAAGRRQYTETQALNPEAAKRGAPSWVWYWCTCIGFMTGTVSCTLSLVGLFGDAALAQLLAVVQLVVAFAGRLAAMPITSVPCFEEGPWHKSFATLALLYAALTAVVFARLAGAAVPPAALFVVWGVSHGLYDWLASLADVTTALYVRVEDRKFVARRINLVTVASGLLGLVVGLAITLLAEGTSNFRWPASDHVIEA